MVGKAFRLFGRISGAYLAKIMALIGSRGGGGASIRGGGVGQEGRYNVRGINPRGDGMDGAKKTPGDANKKSAANFSAARLFKYSLMSEFLLVGDSEERVGKDDDSNETGFHDPMNKGESGSLG